MRTIKKDIIGILLLIGYFIITCLFIFSIVISIYATYRIIICDTISFWMKWFLVVNVCICGIFEETFKIYQSIKKEFKKEYKI